MSFIMDLPPDVETRLYQEASRQGIDRQEAARRLIVAGLPTSGPSDSTAALFAQWAQEDAQMTPEEIAAEDAANAELEAARQPGIGLRSVAE